MNKLILLVTALLLQGCASVLSNSAYPVLIDSEPGGAEFVIKNLNGIEVAHGQTPATVTLESGAGSTLKKPAIPCSFSNRVFNRSAIDLPAASMAGIGATSLIPSACC
ncbi:MAG: hypothetical protein Q8L15_10490 [Methylobacter sp.]|nr:hypothetical protein [Methylobacter sp.]